MSEGDFSALVERSDAQYETAQADARPDLMTLAPRETAGVDVPAIVALHGNNTTMQDTAPSWRSVVTDGWLLAVPQSSEIATTPGFFIWNDRARAADELETHLAALRSRFSIDATRFVLGGFSMGARLALELGLSGRFPARRVLAIATWLPDFQALADLIDPSAMKESRVYVVVGRGDASGHDGSLRLVDHLRSRGIPAEIEVHERGHELPADMPATLRRALAFLCGG
jgi:predicted esterase